MKNKKIAIYDSGIGGLNFLKLAHELLPNEDFIYFADNLYAPYGEKTKDVIVCQSEILYNKASEIGIKAFVIACNTATSLASENLREKYPNAIIIGMEPAINPAIIWAEENAKSEVLVLATKATIEGEKLDNLIKKHSNTVNIKKIACSGLMELIEESENLQNMAKIEEYFKENLEKHLLGEEKAVVLGCTHYLFLKEFINEKYPNIQIFDGDMGTFRQLKSLLSRDNLLKTTGVGTVEIFSTKEEEVFKEKAEKIIFA